MGADRTPPNRSPLRAGPNSGAQPVPCELEAQLRAPESLTDSAPIARGEHTPECSDPGDPGLDRLDVLLSLFADDALGDAELAELGGMLEQSADARTRYVQMALLEADLVDYFAARGDYAEGAGRAASPGAAHVPPLGLIGPLNLPGEGLAPGASM